MPITVKERPRQKAECNFRRPRTVREYVISGTTDRTEAILAVAAASSPFDEGVDIVAGNAVQLFRNGVDVNELGGGKWEATVRYENSYSTSIEIAFQVGVGTKKIFTSLETIRGYDCIDPGPPGYVDGGGDFENIPGFENAIGVNGDRTEGVDIEGGHVEFSVTKKTQFTSIPAAYLALLCEFGYENYVNSTAYSLFWMGQELTFATGCLRFRSFTCRMNSEQELEITYNFAFARAIVGADNWTVGNSIAITKEGWQYAWTHFREEVSASATTMVPVCVKIEKVYRYGNFALLSI